MKLIYAKDYQRMSAAAARLLAAQILEKPNAVLGLATGGTPVGTYQELVCLCGEGLVSFRGVHTVNLDEYCGLSGEHPQSFRYFMNENLFSKVDVLPENTNVPDGMAKDGAVECRRYEELISRLGPVELQVLGIGNNGHIGFNGPDQVFSKGVVYTSLTDDTVRANARFFDRVEDVPTSAYTIGIDVIMRARRLLLLANGQGKAEIMYKALCGPITPAVPASALQLHRDLTVIVDEAAGEVLKSHGCEGEGL